jgi:hypothetical protein
MNGVRVVEGHGHMKPPIVNRFGFGKRVVMMEARLNDEVERDRIVSVFVGIAAGD